MRIIPLLICFAVSTGRARDFRLAPPSYDKPVLVTSSKTATIELLGGAVGGSSGVGVMPIIAGSTVLAVPISSGPYPELHFGKADQKIFISSLASELNRLGLLRVAAPEQNTDPDVRIRILFAQTHHFPGNQRYTLDVAIEIRAKEKVFGNTYHIDSHEGASYWETVTTNAVEGKSKAAKKLMNALIRDIETWMAANPA